MRRVLLVVLVLLALAAVIASLFGAVSTPRVSRGDVAGGSGSPPTARKPRVRTVQSKAAPDVLQDAPLDVPEAGDSSLFLVLTAEASGAPIRSVVDVYRLDVPENEYWTRGDRFQVQVDVPAAGARIRDLPSANYRVVVHGQRFGTEDPPAFGVEGAETSVSLPIPLPQEFEAYLVVRDASGERVHGGGARGGGLRYRLRDVRPDWLTDRTLRHPQMFHPRGLSGGGGGGGVRVSYNADRETANGYRLQPWRQSSKRQRAYRGWTWRKEGWTDVRLTIGADAAGDRHYAGIAREREPILDSIRMPDGSRAVDAGASVEMASRPIEVTGDTPADAWRQCTTNVQVKLEGYEPLSFDLALDEQPSVRTLVVAAPEK